MRTLVLLVLLPLTAAAQGGQTIRGTVVDRDTRVPLVGATVVVVGSEPLLGTATDAEGRFVLRGVPLGRPSVEVRSLGYEPVVLADVLVRAGKETVLAIELREAVTEGAEVVVTAGARDGRALDAMATVSARSFSVEQAERYAGAVDDPARLAAAFAGAATAGSGVQDNALAIRGNAPRGVRWRLEGVPIPNPNHFAGLTVAGGGGLTLFSGRLLADSDVFTGAFPAAYGDALAGVFDMRFRSGNPETPEHTLQVGVIGMEGASEGPIPGTEATYLANYRYSTLGLLMPLLPAEGGITYQDLAFKLAVPTRAGRVEAWGIGGLDAQNDVPEPDSAAWRYGDRDRSRFDLDLGVGAGGLTHHLVLGRAYLRTVAAATVQRTAWTQDRLDDALVLQPDLALRNTDLRLILGSTLTTKTSPRHVNETGVLAQRISYDLDLRAAPDHAPPLAPIAEGEGVTALVEVFSQSRVTPVSGLDVTAGLHAQHLALTGATSVEPRLGLAATLGRQTVSLGYGLHSQAEDLRVYLARPDGVTEPNRDLGFARAHHLVVGTARQLTETVRVGVEGYVQRLFDVPVIADSSFSLLNVRQDWAFAEPLVNAGAGENLGVEVTVERALRGGIYGLVSGSLFRSRYRGGDGVWRPTRFDQRYAVNALAGWEGRVGRRSRLGVNVRLAALGGERWSPVDEAASRERREVVFDEARAFEDRAPGIGLVDLTVTWRLDGRAASHVWALQLKNALAARDVRLDYNLRLDAVEEVREGFPLPVLSYRAEF